MLESPLAIGVFIFFHAVGHIVCAIFQETIDEAGEFMRRGGNGLGCA
jgi:hypothetical protein